MVNYSQLLEQKKGQYKQLTSILEHKQKTLSQLEDKQKSLEAAQVIIQRVGLLTQNQLKFHLSELVTLALTSVFDEPYEFDIEFQQKRGQTEADLWFLKNGERIKPTEASGLGAVDIAAFALRVTLWALKKPKSRPILVLDEPFKYISSNYRVKTSEMLKMISERLGLQIIMVTHSEELVECADKVLVVRQKDGVSKVT